MKNKIPYGKHFIDSDDIEAVVNILKNKNLTQGDEVEYFEKAVAKYVNAKYAVVFSSWTAGLHVANIAIGIKEGDEVITSPITFVATPNSTLYCNAKPVFSDINADTVNLCVDTLEETLKKHPNAKAIIPVHFSGLPCEMEKISSLARQYNLSIIEDAAHALGASYEDGSMVGCCKYSDITGFSFHPVKSIATGEGGMITTNNKKIYENLLRLRSHGINKKSDNLVNKTLAYTDGKPNPWYYEMQQLGFNYRITDIQCALGISQLKKLPKFLKKRRELVEKYDESFSGMKNIVPIQVNQRNGSSNHLYVVRINFKKANISRMEFMNSLIEKNIYTQVHYMPIVMHPYYRSLGYTSSNLEKALKYYEECISLPLFYSLTTSDQSRVIAFVKEHIS